MDRLRKQAGKIQDPIDMEGGLFYSAEFDFAASAVRARASNAAMASCKPRNIRSGPRLSAKEVRRTRSNASGLSEASQSSTPVARMGYRAFQKNQRVMITGFRNRMLARLGPFLPRKTLLDVVERTANQLFVPLTVGGGVRDRDDMRAALNAGADKVSINTVAVQHPEIITQCADDFGSQCVVVAIDAKRTGASWNVYTHGGRKEVGLDVVEWAVRAEKLGAGEILLTSMDADGTKDGYDLELTDAVARNVNIPVIASGGCGNVEHIYDVLTQTKAEAALAASIFHYNELTVGQVKSYLRKRGVPVR